MKISICYDIVSDRRRNRVVKILLGYGYRVQKSVFEAFVSKDDFQLLKERLKKEINLKEDSIRYFHLCEACDKKTEIQGIGKKIEEVQYIIL